MHCSCYAVPFMSLFPFFMIDISISCFFVFLCIGLFALPLNRRGELPGLGQVTKIGKEEEEPIASGINKQEQAEDMFSFSAISWVFRFVFFFGQIEHLLCFPLYTTCFLSLRISSADLPLAICLPCLLCRPSAACVAGIINTCRTVSCRVYGIHQTRAYMYAP